jgi:hypothetical protein
MRDGPFHTFMTWSGGHVHALFMMLVKRGGGGGCVNGKIWNGDQVKLSWILWACDARHPL